MPRLRFAWRRRLFSQRRAMRASVDPGAFGDVFPVVLIMAIVEYTPELFGELQEMVSRVPRVPAHMNLAHRPFVDYYYGSGSCCKLYLFLSDSGRVLGTLGRELLRFEHESREITIRMGSNWFSLHPGVGGQLTKFSAQACPNSIGMMLMASRKALKVLRHYGWVPVPGVTGYF